MLVPHAFLWRGVNTRGPAEKASCSSVNINSIPHRGVRIARQRKAVDARAYEPTAVLQLAPKQRDSVPASGSTPTFPDVGSPASAQDGGEGGGKLLGRGQDEQQSSVGSSGKVLKINIDLMLWRSRTARIKARQTLDSTERKNLYRFAEDGLRRCLLLDPSDPRGYVVLGKTLVQQKRYDEARKLYQDGCANTGNTNPYIWSAWGWLEALTGNPDRARKLYDAAVVVDNTHACAWHKWGMLEKSQGNYTRARDLWMQGIQRCRRKPQSQNAYLYNALGCMAAQLGRVGEARAWFEEGTRTAEGAASVALWQAWGMLEATQGDPTAVRYLFRKALQANPRSRYVHLAWALWERKQGNPQQCLALLQRGSQLNPTDPALFQAWALMEKKTGRIDRARKLFEQGLKADPGYLYLWQAYGVMEAEQGNFDRARQLFQEGVWADPRSPSTVYVFHAWGALEWKAGNIQTARELFKAAVRVDPKNETTWASWIAMESEQGFVERADELRIRQAEQQWEFVVPPGFTTRPAPGLMDTLARFFSARGFGMGVGGGGAGTAAPSEGGGAAATAGAAPSGEAGSKLLLPSDLGIEEERLQLQDIERILDTGDLSLLPELTSPDDDVEASLQPPPRPGGVAGRSRGPADAGYGASSRDGSGPTVSLTPRPRPAPSRRRSPTPGIAPPAGTPDAAASSASAPAVAAYEVVAGGAKAGGSNAAGAGGGAAAAAWSTGGTSAAGEGREGGIRTTTSTTSIPITTSTGSTNSADSTSSSTSSTSSASSSGPDSSVSGGSGVMLVVDGDSGGGAGRQTARPGPTSANKRGAASLSSTSSSSSSSQTVMLTPRPVAARAQRQRSAESEPAE